MGSNSSTNNPVRPRDRRIVLLGKTGAGKSSAGNTIFGRKKVFAESISPNSSTKTCKPETKTIDGREITLIDTPGFFDTGMSEDELTKEIVKCTTECAGGVHAFLIVLKVERYTEHEKEIISKIQQSFSDEAFKFATVLFTHGDDLRGKTIKEFVKENVELSKLVEKCGGRCHVIDNRPSNQCRKNRNRRVQVSKLLKTIDEMVKQNGGGCYTNEMLQAVQEDIQEEGKTIREKSDGKLSAKEIHNQAKETVQTKLYVKMAGIATGVLMGALLGVGTLASLPVIRIAVGSAAKALEAVGGAAAVGVCIGTAVILGTAALAGGIGGGMIGADAAEGKETALEAMGAAATAVFDKAKKTGVL